MNKISSMPNIGETLAKRLMEAGIDAPEKLIGIGSREAFIKIKAIDDTACCNLLYALEGAVQGVRWHSLEKSVKQDLKIFFHDIK